MTYEQYLQMKRGEFWDDVQYWLGVFGNIPVIGEPLDIINAVIYFIRGDYTNAMLSGLSAFPFVGNFISLGRTAAKGARYGDEVLDASTSGAQACGRAERIVEQVKCFVAGTQVHTESGLMNIESIEPGDRVWAFDAESQCWQLCQVEAVSSRDYTGEIASVTIEAASGRKETLEATGNHPFWINGGEELERRPSVEAVPSDEPKPSKAGRWTEARWLRLGDVLMTRSGRSATVVGITIRIERTRVYNLTVTRLQNYSVGDCGVLVHNTCWTDDFAEDLLLFHADHARLAGINNIDEAKKILDDIVNSTNPAIRYGKRADGTEIWYDPQTGLIIIRHPSGAESPGTVFRPDTGEDYFEDALSQ